MRNRLLFTTMSVGGITGAIVGYIEGNIFYKSMLSTNETIKYRIDNYRIKYNLDKEQTLLLKNIVYKNKNEEHIKNIVRYGPIIIGANIGAFYFISLPILLVNKLSHNTPNN